VSAAAARSGDSARAQYRNRRPGSHVRRSDMVRELICSTLPSCRKVRILL
jgi:hypothetical protein